MPCFKVKTPTVAIERPDGTARILFVPTGAILAVVNEFSAGDRLVDVEWDGRRVLMFRRDLMERAEQVTDESTESE